MVDPLTQMGLGDLLQAGPLNQKPSLMGQGGSGTSIVALAAGTADKELRRGHNGVFLVAFIQYLIPACAIHLLGNLPRLHGSQEASCPFRRRAILFNDFVNSMTSRGVRRGVCTSKPLRGNVAL